MYRALVVCNSRFPADPGALPELQGPKVDGTLVRDALTDPSAGLFERSEVRLVSEAEAPEALAAVDDFFGEAEADDTLLFYYSGHGRSRNQQLYLCVGNTRVGRLSSTSIPGSTLSEIISGSFAQVKIVILDCCQSGVFKGDDDLVKGLSGKGRFVIAATSATDRANDAGIRGEPSPFTKALADGLLSDAVDRNGDLTVDLDDLFTYLSAVRFDGHQPHRKFDGAGAVPIARRSPKLGSAPEESPSPSTRQDYGQQFAPAKSNSEFLDEIAEGAVLSEKRIEVFRLGLRDDIAVTYPPQLTSTEFLQRAGLVKNGHPTCAGILLFGENPTAFLATAMVRCVRFHGTHKTDPVESADLNGTLPELIVQARDFIASASLLGESPTAASAFSEPTYRYPMIAVREIIANAVVHRDYTDHDTCVQIHVFDDRIEVVSPGAWGGEWSVPDGQVRLGALERQSQSRNFRLARVLAWGKLVESVGAGLPRSVADCRAVGSPEPIVLIRHGLITVTVFPGETDSAERDTSASRTETRIGASLPMDPGRIAQIIVGPQDAPNFRGSGYRVTNDTVLTAAHLVIGRDDIHVRFGFDSTEWIAPAVAAAVDETVDVAVLRFRPPSDASVVAPARYGQITTRPTIVTVETAGFPLFKRRQSEGAVVRDLAFLSGTIASLANLRSGTLEINVDPPSPASDDRHSPWEGISGAPVWAEGRIVGVLTRHNRQEGLSRITAARIERFLTGRSAEQYLLPALLDFEQLGQLVEVPTAAPEQESPYLEQIIELVPVGGLLDRDSEMAELEAFCHGDETYAMWQGDPWAGKTALMASFALHPPSGFDVVSFFVSGRTMGQSDSAAFADALIEQLTWLLDEPLPAGSMQSGTQIRIYRRLLASAATRAAALGRRVVLLVDGIDEDSGLQSGLPSIASLLPRNPDAGLRVLVSGRRTRLPADVPPDHPLRNCRVLPLVPSALAHEISNEAARELRSVLAAAPQNRDVVGLIAASSDGLNMADLVRLTDLPLYELEMMFTGSLGRIFWSRGDESSAPPKILFAHEGLRTEAAELLGQRLMSTYAALLPALDR